MASRHQLAAIAALALLLGCAPRPSSPPATDATASTERQLVWAGVPLTETLHPGEHHHLELELSRGELLAVNVRQLGVDLALRAHDPAGQEIAAADSLYAERGVEQLWLLAAEPGRYRVEIGGSTADAAGRYELALERRSPTAADRSRLAAFAAQMTGERAASKEDWAKAAEASCIAAEGWAAIGEPAAETLTRHGLGRALEKQDDLEGALAAFETAGRAAEAAGLGFAQADLSFRIGRLELGRARLEAADAAVTRAAQLYAELGEPARQARSVNELAHVAERRGRLDDARRRFLEAAEIAGAAGEQQLHIACLDNLGRILLRLGQHEAALARFSETLALRRQLGDHRGAAITLVSRGTAERRLDQLDAARTSFHEALVIARATDDASTRALAQLGLGLTELRAGRPEPAERALLEARTLLETQDEPRAQARVTLDLAEVALAKGDSERAHALAAEGLADFERLRDPQGIASACFALGRAERRLGRARAAHASFARALAAMEDVREGARVDEQRVSYLAFRREYYEHAVDLAVELDALEPAHGWLAEALALSERGRARGLLELLLATHGEPRAAGSAELLRPQPFDALRFAARELDDDPEKGGTLLLAVALGDERSHLFTLGREGLASFPLPGRAQLDRLARIAHEALEQGARPMAQARAQRALAELSRLVLLPVAERLGERRLVIVAEGGLLYVPFAALPDPRQLDDSNPPPLIERHEIVSLPSAGILEALRARPPRSIAGKTVAILADPVFAPDDPRLTHRLGGRSAVARGELGPPPPRLEHARAEALAIAELVPAPARQLALDFDPSAELLASGELAGYGILHVATHGSLDTDRPELSGLELARYDAAGNPLQGTLYAHEVYELPLGAELVVLSACRTALGREVRGEGLLGLTRAFFYTGARRVVVSLWGVDDAATGELMARFYRHHLQGGRPATAALAAAQREIRADPRWAAATYWAGFIVQGDWR